jgi:uncharacterized membrane protein YesL
MITFAERYPRLWAFLDRISLLVIAGLLFWVASLLVITLPAALVALFAVVGGSIRSNRDPTLMQFWQSFRRSFGTALLLGVIDLALGALIIFDIRICLAVGTWLATGMAFALGSMGMLLVLMNCVAWPLLAWYPQPIGSVIKRSYLLVAAHPLPILAGLLVALATLLLFALLPSRLLALLPLFGPGLATYAIAWAAWSVMKRYADEPDDLGE